MCYTRTSTRFGTVGSSRFTFHFTGRTPQVVFLWPLAPPGGAVLPLGSFLLVTSSFLVTILLTFLGSFFVSRRFAFLVSPSIL